MTEIFGKVAFVTGAASGIGLALTKSLLDHGAKVMMSDINEELLTAEFKSLNGTNVAMTVCDVSKPNSVSEAAELTIKTFSKVHHIFNNAGVSLAGYPGKIALEDWKWITDINLMGVVHCVEKFLPLMLSHGEPAHITNTASMAGHVAASGMGPYFATKYAVVGYSEALKVELETKNIGVSCLCPTWVKSNIHNTASKSPVAGKNDSYKQSKSYEIVKALIENGMDAEVYAELCIKGIQSDRLHIFNDPLAREAMTERHKLLQKDYDQNLTDLAI